MHVGLKISWIFPAPPPFLQPPCLSTFLRGHYLFVIDVEMKRYSKLGSTVKGSLSLVPFAEWKLVPGRSSGTYLSPQGKSSSPHTQLVFKFLKTRTPLSKKCHQMCSYLRPTLFSKFGKIHLSCDPHRWWPSYHLSRLWLLIYCTRIFISPQLQ